MQRSASSLSSLSSLSRSLSRSLGAFSRQPRLPRARNLSSRALPSYKIARREFEGEDGSSSGNGSPSPSPPPPPPPSSSSPPPPPSSSSPSQFPWVDGFELEREGRIYAASQIVSSLEPIISEERRARIERVIENRCFSVLPLIENPHDWGNVSAVCRTADALGFGALHIIRDKKSEKYKQSARTAGGSDKWLDIQLHDSSRGAETRAVFEGLKRRGFQIVATALGTPEKLSKRPDEIDWTRPTVVVFGNELEGVSAEVLELADAYCEIPIDGFVESYNVSVAASLILWEARRQRLEALGAHGDLEPAEKNVLRAVYYLRNKGQFVSYASQLLRREPPQWQQDRKLSWGEKEFDVETYVDGKYVRKLKAKNVVCHLWDGETCLGEKYLYKEGRPCRYARAHQPGRSTLNLEKLRDQAARYQVGHKIPELLENMCNRSGRSPLSDKGRIPGQENP